MTRIVDSHTHVISSDLDVYPTNPLGGKQSTWSQEHPVDEAGLLAAMDDAGVERAVVVQASTVYGHDNSYLADVVARHPDRMTGVFSIDAVAPDAIDQLDRWRDRGLRGFRLFTTGTTMPGQADWLGHPASLPMWEHAAAHDIPGCLQMTLDGIPALTKVLEQVPTARVVLDHCARPDLADGPPYQRAHGLFDLAAFPGVHLKLTHRALSAAAEGSSTVREFLRAVMDVYGSERVMWGSNFPAAAGTLLDLVAHAEADVESLSEIEKKDVFGDTAETFYAAHQGPA